VKFILSVFFLVISSQLFSQNWQKIQDFAGTERDDAVIFTINNIAYCGTGLSPWFAEFADFYSFNFITQSWASIAGMPVGSERQYATAFSNDTLGFVFGGNKGDVYLNDLWMYNPTDNSWVQKTSLPSFGRNGACCFVLNNTAYIVGGKTANNTFLSEVWAYDIHNNQWEQKNDFQFGNFWRSSATSLNEFGYVVFGKDSLNNYSNRVYKYSPFNDSWNILAEFPSSGRTYCSIQKLYDKLFLIAGTDSSNTYYNDFWSFDLQNNQFTELQPINSLPFKGGVSFSVGNEIYYTTGINNQNIRLKDTWRISNPTLINKQKNEEDFAIYPNPCQGVLKIECKYKFTKLWVRDLNQKNLIHLNYSESKNTELNISELQNGIYFLELELENGIKRKKFVIK
jgi:N-acetylneuraminic acid mutarotase